MKMKNCFSPAAFPGALLAGTTATVGGHGAGRCTGGSGDMPALPLDVLMRMTLITVTLFCFEAPEFSSHA